MAIGGCEVSYCFFRQAKWMEIMWGRNKFFSLDFSFDCRLSRFIGERCKTKNTIWELYRLPLNIFGKEYENQRKEYGYAERGARRHATGFHQCGGSAQGCDYERDSK